MGASSHKYSIAHQSATRRKLLNACRPATPSFATHSILEPLEPRTLLAAGPVGAEFAVGTPPTNGYQWDSVIAMDHDGDYVIAWAAGDPHLNIQIYAQQFNAAGIPQTAELRLSDTPINCSSDSSSIHLSVAMDDQHNFVATWASRTDDPQSGDIYACRYNAVAGKVGSIFRVNTITEEEQQLPVIAMDAGGDFLVAWESSEGLMGTQRIRAQRFDSSARPIGGEFAVSMGDWPAGAPSVAMNSQGDSVVTWTSGGQGQDHIGVYARRYNASGEAQGDELRVTPVASYGPVVALADTGNFAVAWDGVQAQFFDSQGTPQGGAIRVNTYNTGYQVFPSIAADADGDWVVVWRSRNQDGSGNGIYGQQFDATGTLQGSEFRVNTHTNDDQDYPAVAMDAHGNFTVVWNSIWQDGFVSTIRGQRFAVPSTPASISGRVWNDANGNGLQDPGEAGIAGAGITLYTPLGLPVASTTTSTEGLYEFPGLLPDQKFYIQVTKPSGFTFVASNAGTDDAIDSDISPATGKSDLFTFAPGQDHLTLDAGMVSKSKISGTVFYDLNKDGTLAGSETGLANWIIFLDADGDGQLDPNEFSTESNPDGSYTLEEVPPGAYTVTQASRDLWVLAPPRTVSVGIGQAITNINFANTTNASSAFLTPIGGERLVRDTIPFSPAFPDDIAIDAEGNSVVVWCGRVDATQWNIYGQRLNAAGIPQGDPFLVNTTLAGEQMNARVAMNANGDFVVVWVDHGQGASKYINGRWVTFETIRARRYNAQGIPQGAEFQVSPADMAADCVSIAMDAQGNFAIAYSALGSTSNVIYVQQYNAAGIPQGSPIRADISKQRAVMRAEIAMAPDGRFVLVWDAKDKSGISGMYAQRFDNTGHPLGNSFRASTSTTGSVSHPSVSMDSKGNFILGWQHYETTEGPGYDEDYNFASYVRRYSANGVPQGNPFRPESDPGNQFGGQVAMTDSGNFILTWSARSGSKAQLYNAAGVPQGDAIDFPATTFAINASGDMIGAWSTEINEIDNGPIQTSVRVRRYVVASSDTVITGSADRDTFYLTRADDQILIYSGSTATGTPLATLPLANTASLTLNALGSRDVLYIDFSNGDPIPPKGLFFNGGASKDTIILLGTDDTTKLSVSPDRILFNSSRITPANIEALSLGVTPNKQILLDSLTIDGPARLRMPTGNHLLATNALSIRNGGMLDLIDGNLVLHTTGQTRDQLLTDTLALLRTGRSSGATFWQGPGLASFGARTDRQTGLFAALNNQGDATPLLATLNDLPLSPTDILVLYALNGDTNLDGAITDEDYEHIDTGYLLGTSGCRNGDLNYDNLIDAADYFLIDSAYITQPGSTPADDSGDTSGNSTDTASAKPTAAAQFSPRPTKPDPLPPVWDPDRPATLF